MVAASTHLASGVRSSGSSLPDGRDVGVFKGLGTACYRHHICRKPLLLITITRGFHVDRAYVSNSSYSYNFGRFYHGDNHFLGGVTNGWILSGLTLWQSGNNLQANNSPNFGLSIKGIGAPTYFGTDAARTIQPVETCDPRANLAHLQRANMSCFAAPAIGTNGPSTSPYLRNSDFFDTDLAAYKSFSVAEHQSVRFRISASIGSITRLRSSVGTTSSRCTTTRT